MKPFLSLFILLTAFFLHACSGDSCGGTDTGNPSCPSVADSGDDGGSSSDDSGEDSPVSTEAISPANQILDALCIKLNECFTGLSTVDCTAGILDMGNLEDNFGLTDGSYGIFEEIIDAENAGEITADATALTTCLTDISNLTCSSDTAQSAYDESAATDFDNVQNMIPTGSDSCGGVY